MKEKKVLIAGATGYLGQYLVKEANKQGYWVRALTRESSRLEHLSDCIDEQYIGQVTTPKSIVGVCKNIDVVITSIGITKQKDGLTYNDVDYQGNLNLLNEAIKSGCGKFIYISVFNADKMNTLKAVQAKLKFENKLENSGLNYSIIRPNGFFSDMMEYLKMAQNGKGYLFGDGDNKINPIHGEDLAKCCVNAILGNKKIINIGGPDIYTHREILEMAFQIINKKPKISQIPIWMSNMIVSLVRTFTPVKIFGPIEFFMTVLAVEMAAPTFGSYHLKEFFIQNCDLASKAHPESS